MGLQHQLVNSVQVSKAKSSSTDLFPNGGYISSVGNIGAPSNKWFQYFGKGQQDSNPTGLIAPASESFVNRQLQLQKQVEQNIQKRTYSGRR